MYQQLAAGSVAPNFSTSAFDDYFAYNLTDPITIRKNESALVPILQTKVNAERVTLWSQQQPVPLRALWVTNTSDLTLDRGSFTIVENGDFGGEGLLDPIHPGEKRLLSYAVDQAVRVTTSDRSPDSHVTEFIIADGTLRQISSDSRSVEYTVHNAAPEPRTVIIERPLSNGWTLAPSSAQPEETTSTVNPLPGRRSVRRHRKGPHRRDPPPRPELASPRNRRSPIQHHPAQRPAQLHNSSRRSSPSSTPDTQ